MGYDDVVSVHVDDQMDGKSLIGSYVWVVIPTVMSLRRCMMPHDSVSDVDLNVQLGFYFSLINFVTF